MGSAVAVHRLDRARCARAHRRDGQHNPPRFIGNFVMSGFNFASVQAKGIDAQKRPPTETLARFTSLANSSNHPPGPTDTWLGEVIVHSEDIRRALGIKHAYPTDAAVQVANFYKNSNLLIGAKTRITGLKLRATDADWSTGDGLARQIFGRPGKVSVRPMTEHGSRSGDRHGTSSAPSAAGCL